MAASGYTPISLYYSTTSGAGGIPSAANLVNGELAINITDGKLYYKDNSGVVQTLATKSGVVPLPYTANGVVYASSTSALTTGSALTFDGTNLGIGTSSPTYNLEIYASLPQMRLNATTGTNAAFYRVQNTGGSGFIGLENSTGSALSTGAAYSLNLYHGGAYPILFSTNAAERMRLDSSGNLGIGTSSPAYKLDVAGDIALKNNATYLYSKTSGGTVVRMLGINSGNTAYVGPIDSGPGDMILNASSSSANIQFYATGSEQMRLTSTGLGIGTSSPVNKLVVSNAGAAGFEVNPADASGVALAFYNRSGAAYANSIYYASNQIFCAGGTTEGMRLTSTGLGIGTTSPATKLHVNTAAAGYGITIAASSQTSITYQLGIDSNSNLAVYDTNAAAQRLVLSTSGNLGLGVTPSAWTSGWKALQIGSTSSLTDVSNTSTYWNNTYVTGASSPIYQTTAAASFYRQTTGQHIWYNAPSGTAGNAITFTQAMTLADSGNLLVGTTSGNSRLSVINNDTNSSVYVQNQATFTGGANFAINGLLITSGGDVAGNTTRLCLGVGSGSQVFFDSENVGGANSGSNLLIYTRANGGGMGERVRIDSSGNVGIGTTSPSQKLHLSVASATGVALRIQNSAGNTYLSTQADGHTELSAADASGYITFMSGGGTERMRLDSSGNLLVGATSAPTTQGFAALAYAGGTYTRIAHNTSAISSDGFIQFYRNASEIGSITQNGTTGVLYNITSDQRLKENIQNSESASDLIDAIQVRQFDWKSDGSHHRYGFVAQELVTVAPEAVNQPADPEEMMAVDYSKLVPMLVKEIQSLRIRIAQLEAK